MKSLSLNQPHALVMVGVPGSGKSTFAGKFSQTFNAPLVDIDTILPLAKDETAADQLLLAQLEEIVRTKSSLVIEADASSRVRRTELAKFLREADYVPLFVWVQTDTDTARQRSKKQNRMVEQDFDQAIKRFSAPHESERALVISGKHTYASQAKIVLKRLSVTRTETPTAPTPRPGRIAIQ